MFVDRVFCFVLCCVNNTYSKYVNVFLRVCFVCCELAGYVCILTWFMQPFFVVRHNIYILLYIYSVYIVGFFRFESRGILSPTLLYVPSSICRLPRRLLFSGFLLIRVFFLSHREKYIIGCICVCVVYCYQEVSLWLLFVFQFALRIANPFYTAFLFWRRWVF